MVQYPLATAVQRESTVRLLEDRWQETVHRVQLGRPLLHQQRLQSLPVSHARQEPSQFQQDPQSVPPVTLDQRPMPTLSLPAAHLV